MWYALFDRSPWSHLGFMRLESRLAYEGIFPNVSLNFEWDVYQFVELDELFLWYVPFLPIDFKWEKLIGFNSEFLTLDELQDIFSENEEIKLIWSSNCHISIFQVL